ncbi:MAG TPA: lasso peptide biosynthesis B2 protein [Actinomycetota bacterium]|nr:lasso peptide biosynthesis B2 protein [Actinomycetota bacterium]
MKVDVPTLRAAWWTFRASRKVRSELEVRRLDEISVEPPPRLPDSAVRGVAAILRRTTPTCLVQALVLQTWHRAHGRNRDVIIGVTKPSEGFRAHAWLDGDPPCHDEGFAELTRRAPA